MRQYLTGAIVFDLRFKIDIVFVRILVTFSTLHSFISVKKFFDEHVYLTQTRMTLVLG